jgi:phage/plasmid-associated DNA primase
MNSRFEGFGLYKKLMCSMGETNFGTMTRTSKLKKLSGQDLVSFEKKGIQGFNDVNYAKLIINSNSLPSSLDTSDGFYRRWFIIKFPNEFPEGKDIISTVPEVEYENMAYKVINILPKLLEKGSFTNQGTIEQRKNMFIMNSNPFPLFMKHYCEQGEGYSVLYGELFAVYVQFLRSFKMRKVTMREFKSSIEDEGFFMERTSKKVVSNDNIQRLDEDVVYKNGLYVEGLRLKVDKNHTFCEFSENMNTVPFQSSPLGSEIESHSQLHKITKLKDFDLSEEKVK